jgi:hypothetical protein
LDRLAAGPDDAVRTRQRQQLHGRTHAPRRRCNPREAPPLRSLAGSCEHDSIFSLAYLRHREQYRRTIEDPTFFEDTALVNHEDAIFAAYYFKAFDAWCAGSTRGRPACLAAAFQARRPLHAGERHLSRAHQRPRRA